MDAEALRQRLAKDLSLIRAWSSEAREKYLNTLWEAEGAPRATRRAVLREIAGLTYEQIVAAQRMAQAKYAAPAAPARPAQDADYWHALADFAHFTKGITR